MDNEARIEIEGSSLQDALQRAEEQLGVAGPHEYEYEYDREHFRSGAATVKLFVWKKDPALVEGTAFAHEFVLGFLERFGVEGARVRVYEEPDKVVLSVKAGEEGNLLIGREGKNLNALQHLLTSAMAHQGHDVKAVIDIEQYRSRREDRLRERASETCEDVLRTGEPYVTQPLNSYERRIVHMVVREHEGVRSRSVGSGKMKKLEIAKD